MASVKPYLDKRYKRSDNMFPLKLYIAHRGKCSLMYLNILIKANQWDEKNEKIIFHPNKNELNALILKIRLDVEQIILSLTSDGSIRKMSAKELRNRIFANGEEDQRNLFANRLKAFAERKKASTRELYMFTYKRISDFDKNMERLTFEDIDREWLKNFDSYLSRTVGGKKTVQKINADKKLKINTKAQKHAKKHVYQNSDAVNLG